MKALEVKNSMVFNFFFKINLLYHISFFFLIIDLYFLMIAAISQICIPTKEFGIPEAEAETNAFTIEAKKSKRPI